MADGEAGDATLPDVPFITGAHHGWHAIARAYAAGAIEERGRCPVAAALCGAIVRGATRPELMTYDRTAFPGRMCIPCGWAVAAAGGRIALQAEAVRWRPAADELPALARLLPDPFVAVKACQDIIAAAASPCGDHELDHPATIQLLAAITAHAPVLLSPLTCIEDGCEHDTGGGCDYAAVACAACSLQAGEWAGEWEGQVLPECKIAAPCAVLARLAASAASARVTAGVPRRPRRRPGHPLRPPRGPGAVRR
jgi:hypothetical protein